MIKTLIKSSPALTVFLTSLCASSYWLAHGLSTGECILSIARLFFFLFFAPLPYFWVCVLLVSIQPIFLLERPSIGRPSVYFLGITNTDPMPSPGFPFTVPRLGV